jgi:hypothetical protein
VDWLDEAIFIFDERFVYVLRRGRGLGDRGERWGWEEGWGCLGLRFLFFLFFLHEKILLRGCWRRRVNWLKHGSLFLIIIKCLLLLLNRGGGNRRRR